MEAPKLLFRSYLLNRIQSITQQFDMLPAQRVPRDECLPRCYVQYHDAEEVFNFVIASRVLYKVQKQNSLCGEATFPLNRNHLVVKALHHRPSKSFLGYHVTHAPGQF